MERGTHPPTVLLNVSSGVSQIPSFKGKRNIPHSRSIRYQKVLNFCDSYLSKFLRLKMQ